MPGTSPEPARGSAGSADAAVSSAGSVAVAEASSAVPRAGPPAPSASSARQPNTPAERFGWPLAPPHPVVRPFQAPSSPYGPGHRGVDLGGSTGEPVLAAAAGVVVFAGDLAGRGVVSVDHPNGLRTTYEPVAPAVEAGQRVAAGAVLGHLRPGHLGCTGAPACLHWGVRRGEEYLDPLALVSTTGRVRLLPWKEES
nr:peptidoglycan DD-metalloendopeptidase family protein [Actinophytocola sp.]